MKKRLIFILAASVILTFQSNAQLLWKISGNGLEKPSYLFGTHHVAPIHICDSIAGFNEAFNSCKQLYGELELDDIQAVSKEIAKYTLLPQDSLLDKLYTPEEYKLIDEVVKKNMGVSADQLKMLKPVTISTQLSVIISMQAFNDFNPTLPLDAFLQKKAKEQGMSVKGFETSLFQAQILFGEPLPQQASALLKTIKHFDKMKPFIIEMCDVYMKQNLDSIFKLMQDPELSFTPEEMNRLVNNRNHNWSQQLKDILPQQPTFIVVGGGHLPGSNGLIELLRKQGFTVTPVE
ncbi:TraB/GumN family protein [Culturomica massiliensis]|uniref:TraB/GumN family protein n=1 Tax=Culturomica massiliensis TaxID=1841857 RepID=UPI000837E453|nr:TraB/GumN family protein [Culturomica massiliensis]